MTDWPYKLYAIMSEEAVKASKGSRGKLIAQGGHAYMGAFLDAQSGWPEQARSYVRSQKFVKICLIAPEAKLIELHERYYGVCGVALIVDAALTVYERSMITALGIGPIRAEEIGDDLKELKVFT